MLSSGILLVTCGQGVGPFLVGSSSGQRSWTLLSDRMEISYSVVVKWRWEKRLGLFLLALLSNWCLEEEVAL